MRRLLTVLVLAACLPSVARAQVVESLREQVKVREVLLQGQLEDVQQALVGADLELLAGLLVHVRRAQHGKPLDVRR